MSEILLLMAAGRCLIIVGGWLDWVLMQSGWFPSFFIKYKIIKKHNRAILNKKPTISEDGCNCREKTRCPLKSKCRTTSIIYEANVTSDSENREKKYVGLTEGTFKNDSMATSCLSRTVNT